MTNQWMNWGTLCTLFTEKKKNNNKNIEYHDFITKTYISKYLKCLWRTIRTTRKCPWVMTTMMTSLHDWVIFHCRPHQAVVELVGHTNHSHPETDLQMVGVQYPCWLESNHVRNHSFFDHMCTLDRSNVYIHVILVRELTFASAVSFWHQAEVRVGSRRLYEAPMWTECEDSQSLRAKDAYETPVESQ